MAQLLFCILMISCWLRLLVGIAKVTILACEKELDAIDMVINVKKSSCLRVRPRLRVTCAEITTSDGNNLLWVNEIRYFGIFIVSHVSFRCSTDHAKRSFYRAANTVFCQGWSLCFWWGDTGVDSLKNVYQSLLMDWRCVLCLKDYCSLLILQLIVS